MSLSVLEGTQLTTELYAPEDLYGPEEKRQRFIEEVEQIEDVEGPVARSIADVLRADQAEDERVELAMQYEDLAHFATRNLSGPEEPPYDGRFLISEHHDEWSELITDHDRLCILSSRDHGKCGEASTLLLAADGRRVKLKDWRGGEVLALNEKTRRLVRCYCPPPGPAFVEPGVLVRTQTGRRVTVTRDHPLLTFEGWKEAATLKVGERIAAPRQYPELGGEALPWARELGVEVASREEGDPDGRIYDEVFTADLQGVVDFLCGYMSAGQLDAPEGSVKLRCASEEILRGLMHLLLRVGVLAVMMDDLRLLIPPSEVDQLAYVLRGASTPELRGGLPRELSLMASGPIFWDELVEVSEVGDAEFIPITVPEHHNYVAEDIVQHNTFFCDFAYPIWQAWRNPKRSGFIFSATQAQARRILRDIREEVETNKNLGHLLPDKKERWNDDEARFANGHTIYARGYGTKVRGAHPVWIVADDVLNDETAYSATQRMKQNNYFFNAIVNMVTPGGQILVIGCVTGDTWVQTERGLAQIAELMPKGLGPKEFADIDLTVEGLDGPRKATRFWNNGVCETRRISLKNGLSLEGSCRHPVWTMGADGVPGWRRLDALREGDEVAVRLGAQCWGEEEVGPEEAYLIGLFTGDGCWEKTGRLTITTPEPEIVSWLKQHGAALGLSWRKGCDDTHWRASSKRMMERWRGFGVCLGRSFTKVVPAAIMRGSRRSAISFLRGLFDTDGCAYQRQGQVVLAQTSRTLAEQVQQVLLNLGIHSYLREKPTQKTALCPGASHNIWWLTLTGSDARLFVSVVGFGLPRKQQAGEGFPCPKASERSRTVPAQAPLLQRIRSEKPRRGRDAGIPVQPCSFAGANSTRRIGIHRLKKLATWFDACGASGPNTDQLRENIRQVESGIVWVPVAEISVGEAQTYDFVIEGDHSFVSNGLVSHNTPFHTGDLYAELRKMRAFSVRSYPAILDAGTENERPLWPERYSLERLYRRRDEEIGSIRFTREFMVQPISDDLTLFPSSLFAGNPVEQPHLRLGDPKQWRGLDLAVYQGVDFAIGTREDSDFTVIFTLGVDERGNRWILDIERLHGASYKRQKSAILRSARRWKPDMMFLESNQMQAIFGNELIEDTDLPIYQFHTSGKLKHSLEAGLPGIRTLLEHGKFRLPMGDQHSVTMIELWQGELTCFMFDQGKVQSIGDHDDIAMASWICDQAVRMGLGFSAVFSEEDLKEEIPEPEADLEDDDEPEELEEDEPEEDEDELEPEEEGGDLAAWVQPGALPPGFGGLGGFGGFGGLY